MWPFRPMTRPQRPGEVDGREYWFLDDDEFTRKVDAGAFLEWVPYVSGRRYGTLRSEIERIADEGKVCVLELELDGALRVQDEVPGSVTIFIAADVPELERRLRDRATESTGENRRAHRARAGAARAGAPLPVHGAERRPRAGDGRARRRRGLRARVRRYHGAAMIHPRIDELLDRVEGSRYALVIIAAKRARQINNYHHQLGEGIGFEEAPAADRVPLEELPHHGDGRGRGRQDHVPRPAGLAGSRRGASCSASPGGSRPTRRARWCACSSGRATKCTPWSPRTPRASSARRPSSPSRADAKIQALPASRAGRPAGRRPADGEHARATCARARGRPPDRGGARPSGAGARRAGDEHAHVGAPGHAGQRRRPPEPGVELVGPAEGDPRRGRGGRREDGGARGDRGQGRRAPRRGCSTRPARR